MNVYCCECGKPVPVSEDEKIIGHCARHPEAKRTRKNWVHEHFDAIRKIVDQANGAGRVFRGDFGEPIQRLEIRGYAVGRAGVR